MLMPFFYIRLGDPPIQKRDNFGWLPKEKGGDSMSFTKRGERFDSLTDRIVEVLNYGCLVCGPSSQATVNKVAAILGEYGIDPKDVEQEMLTLTENFVFAENWKNSGSGGECYVDRRHFLAVCYKLLP
jgi:hypothetical protein